MTTQEPCRPASSRPPWRTLAAAAIGFFLFTSACTGSAEESPEAAADTLTRQQRDSLVGGSGLPGAQGVRAAIRARDRADAMNARLDSITKSGQP